MSIIVANKNMPLQFPFLFFSPRQSMASDLIEYLESIAEAIECINKTTPTIKKVFFIQKNPTRVNGVDLSKLVWRGLPENIDWFNFHDQRTFPKEGDPRYLEKGVLRYRDVYQLISHLATMDGTINVVDFNNLIITCNECSCGKFTFAPPEGVMCLTCQLQWHIDHISEL